MALTTIFVLSVVSAFGIVSDSKARQEVIQVSNDIYPSAVSQESDFVLDKAIDKDMYDRCIASTRKIVDKFDVYTYGLKDITIHARLDLRRGLASSDKIWMRCLTDLEEFENVLIHELGHIVDHNYLVKNYSENKSEEFYNISVGNPSIRGFVSGYAQTNKKEDFAETFLFYVKFGNEFRFIMQSNELLISKYNFMRDSVFDGFEFGFDEALRLDIVDLYSDVIDLPYDVSVLYKM